jgi:transcriptional regulator with XRE-family HTH domain
VSEEADFNMWLRARLKARRMSQRQLAHLSGVDHSTISRLLAGDRSPSLTTAVKLARALRDFEVLPEMVQASRPQPGPVSDPTAGVEYALRSDALLSDAQVRRVMEVYLRMRRLPSPPDGMRTVLRPIEAPAAPPAT